MFSYNYHMEPHSFTQIEVCHVFPINYLSGPIVAQDEFEMVSSSDGFSLLRRQKKLSSSLSTLETTGCMLLDLKIEKLQDQCHSLKFPIWTDPSTDMVNSHAICNTFRLKSGKSAQVFTLL